MTLRRAQVTALAQAITRVGRFDLAADSALTAFFREHHELGVHDRSLVADGTFAWLRRRRSLEALAQTDSPRLVALAVLVRELGHSVRELEAATSAAERDWLAQFKARVHEELPEAVAADVPDWLWERLGAIDVDRAALVRAWQAPAPLDLRVNVLKATRDEALAALEAQGLGVTATPWSPWGLRVAGRPSLARHAWLADGRLEVQDEGSQIVGALMAPKRSDMVVDFCAGAGGKTLLLATQMRSQGRVYAFDTSAARLARLAPRLRRSGLSNVHPQTIASERDPRIGRLAGKIDRVLVDAPCTGFGTLRRNPDLKWRRSERDVAELADKQRRILDAAATLVKPGGRLVYATCSVLPEENDAVADAFLAAHPEFHEASASEILAKAGIALDTGARLRTWPHRHGCDAFFAAVFERAPASIA
ncbi:MAG: RsmB/NOP family class I SAM-dependent RNA methyltransferase [Proteobacteria bacterium]|nr:RsmB/NOP family class I SAM-dependent RNA methyltransferase [Pseudomonadota bacterium]